MIIRKIKFLMLAVLIITILGGLFWFWSEGRAENARLLAWSECRRHIAEKELKASGIKNKRIISNAQEKFKILSNNDVGFDILLDLLRRGEL